MTRLTSNTQRVLSAALTLVVLGCSDEPTNAPVASDQRSWGSVGSLSPVDVPAVVMDLPPAPRPWDTDDSALVRALVEAGGYAVVGFKAPASSRAVEASGFRAAVAAGEIQAAMAVLQGRGVEILSLYNSIGAALVRLNPAEAPPIRQLPVVDYLEPRGTVQWSVELASLAIAAPLQAAARSAMGQIIPWGINMVRAPEAWAVNRGGGVKIGLIGQVVEVHEDLPQVPCANFGGPYASDCNTIFVGSTPSGTFIAGILGARDNTVGVVGVGPGIAGPDIYVWVACHPGIDCYVSDVVAGIDALRWAGAKVISIVNAHNAYDFAEANAVAQAWAAGIVLVAPAGNNQGSFVTYPAALTNVVGVSGVQSNKDFASTSPCVRTDGSRASSNSGSHVDLSAPFWARSTVNYNGYQDETQGWCGTGLSVAHVVGAVALLRSQNPTWTSSQIVSRLFTTALDRGTAGRDDSYGYGIVDAAYALGIAPPPPPPPPLSGVSISGPSAVEAYLTCLWIANPSGGVSPFTYAWTVDGVSVGDATSELTYTAGSTPFRIDVTVTDAIGATTSNSVFVDIDPNAGFCPL